MSKCHEISIPLTNGGTLRCGEGEESDWGGYIRICDQRGRELLYWDVAEWEEDGEKVIGSIFAAAQTSLKDIRQQLKSMQPTRCI